MLNLNILSPDPVLKDPIQKRIDLKTKPPGSLGLIENIAAKVALIQQTLHPEICRPTIAVMAGDHGIIEEGVSPFPGEVTAQMVMNFLNGGAAINVFANGNKIDLKIVDAGVKFNFTDFPALIKAKIQPGTENFAKHPAMSNKYCEKAIETGAGLVEKWYLEGCNTIGFGEMGIGNTTSAAALMAVITGLPVDQCTGAGTGLDQQGIMHKAQVIRNAIELHQGNPKNPLEILATFGGYEIAMICGGMLKAASLKMLIIVDGFITTSALLVAHQMAPAIIDYCIFSHCSDEAGHRKMLQYLKATSLLNLEMRLGEGTGAALAIPLVQAAVNMMNNMASFEEAKVSNRAKN